MDTTKTRQNVERLLGEDLETEFIEDRIVQSALAFVDIDSVAKDIEENYATMEGLRDEVKEFIAGVKRDFGEEITVEDVLQDALGDTVSGIAGAVSFCLSAALNFTIDDGVGVPMTETLAPKVSANRMELYNSTCDEGWIAIGRETCTTPGQFCDQLATARKKLYAQVLETGRVVLGKCVVLELVGDEVCLSFDKSAGITLKIPEII